MYNANTNLGQAFAMLTSENGASTKECARRYISEVARDYAVEYYLEKVGNRFHLRLHTVKTLEAEMATKSRGPYNDRYFARAERHLENLRKRG